MKKFIILIASLFIGFTLYAQSADAVTDILESPEITLGQACYLSAVSQGFVSENASYEEAADAITNQGQGKYQNLASEPAKLSELASIYANLFNLKGGLLYRLTKGSPRYAFKLLKTEGIIPQNYDPSRKISGAEALNIFTKCNIMFGEPQFTDEL